LLNNPNLPVGWQWRWYFAIFNFQKITIS
jgi:hypothetical protein